MDPILVTLASPHHDLQKVGSHVVRNGLQDYLRGLKLRCGANELFYLATCQRVVWVLWGGDAAKMPVQEPLIFEGQQSWHHLVSLASGLASANPGDLDIPTQLRRAMEDSMDCGCAGEECRNAMEDVLREGSRLRSRLGLDRGAASVASVALRRIEQQLEPGAKVALVGTGAMTKYLAERLPARGFTPVIVNRTLENAIVVAEPLGLSVLPLQRFQSDPTDFDAAVTATGAHEPIFTKNAWQQSARAKSLLLIDLALPADSEAALAELPWMERITLEDCLQQTEQTLALRRNLAQQAGPLLTESSERLHMKAKHRSLRRERHHLQLDMGRAWDQLEADSIKGPLSRLDAEQQEALRSLMQRGRTLAFRALAQGHITSEVLSDPVHCESAIP